MLTLALVGRPNVGKSTLFNRLVGARQAIVSPMRGTTRDRVYGEVRWRGSTLRIIDTGGVEFDVVDGIGQAVQRHIHRAVQESDLVLVVCDAQEGIVPADALIVEALRKTGKPMVIVVNKADHRLLPAPEAFALGVSEVLPISALHGRGIGELLDRVRLLAGGQAHQTESPIPPGATATPRFAIVGRQNVGKSSLVNALLREERVIVSDQPGTTRDAIDSRLVIDGRPVILIDTAGLRHRRKVRMPVDLFAMARSFEAIERCDTALVVLDATEGITRDDRRIIARICELGCGLVLLANKWDAVKGVREPTLIDTVHRAMPSAAFAPVVAVSAKTGFHVTQSIRIALQVVARMREGLAETECVTLLRRIWESQRPPRVRGRAVHLQGARWSSGRPARLELTTKPAVALPRPYQQYLIKRLHAHPKLVGVPVAVVTASAAGFRKARR